MPVCKLYANILYLHTEFKTMEKEVFISLYLDTRRAKSNNQYPVKVRVFTNSPRIQKLYPTKFDFTEKEFESIWETTKPRKEHQETRRELQAVENLAIETAKTIRPFNFEQFEKKLYRGKGEGQRCPHPPFKQPTRHIEQQQRDKDRADGQQHAQHHFGRQQYPQAEEQQHRRRRL